MIFFTSSTPSSVFPLPSSEAGARLVPVACESEGVMMLLLSHLIARCSIVLTSATASAIGSPALTMSLNRTNRLYSSLLYCTSAFLAQDRSQSVALQKSCEPSGRPPVSAGLPASQKSPLRFRIFSYTLWYPPCLNYRAATCSRVPSRESP